MQEFNLTGFMTPTDTLIAIEQRLIELTQEIVVLRQENQEARSELMAVRQENLEAKEEVKHLTNLIVQNLHFMQIVSKSDEAAKEKCRIEKMRARSTRQFFV